jgi:excinuclease ABC subunit A
MGPEGGEEGGHIVATGTPEQVAAVGESHTGDFLRRLVEPAAPRKRARRKVAAAA